MANRAIQDPFITITVVDLPAGFCLYHMKNDPSKIVRKPFEAHNFNDHYILQGLKVGSSYVVKQVVRGKWTYWETATECWNPGVVNTKKYEGNPLLEY
jgi:hypothetical protein